MSRKKNAVRNIIWGIINKGIATLLPFLTRTVLLYQLGTEYVGLNSLFISILGLLSLSELGIGTALIFSMYEPLATGNTKKVCALMQLYKRCYRVIGTIVLGIGLLILPFLKYMIADGYPASINLYVLYSVYLCNTILTYWLFAYKKSLLIACQRVDIQTNINTVILMLQNLIQFAVLLVFENYYLYVIVMPFCTILENLIVSFYTKKMYPQFHPKGAIKLNELLRIKRKIIGLLYQRIGNVVLSSVDSIVISTFLGLNILGKYNNYYYIVNALFGFLAIAQTSLKPIVGNSIVLETPEKNYKDFKKMNFLYLWILTWATTTLLCMYQPFMKLWIGDELMLPISIMILMVIYFFIYKWGDMLFVYQEAAGIWWETRYVPILAALVNLIGIILMVKGIGLAGIPLSTIISIFFIYDIGYAKILFQNYFGSRNLKRFLRTQALSLLVAFISCSITFFIVQQIHIEGISQLIIASIICLIIPNMLLWIVYHKTEEYQALKFMLIDKLQRQLK